MQERGAPWSQGRSTPELGGAELVELEEMGAGIPQATSRTAAALCSTSWWPSEEGPGHLDSWGGGGGGSTPGDCVSQAEFREDRCRAYWTPGWSLADFSLQTLKEGPVGERKQTG